MDTAKPGMMAEGGLLHAKALPPFAALRAFEAVGRLGGIRKAAASLSLDHAVVSRHVRALEDWVGQPLCRRIGGKINLTEAGSRYHAKVSSVLIELASATLDLLHRGEQLSIRVWCVPGFATQWLSDELAEFEQIRPEYRVELRPTDTAADLLMHEADVDIRFYGDDWAPRPGGRGLKQVALARPSVMAVASPSLASRLEPVKSVSDLLDAPLLHEEHDEQWRAWFRAKGVAAPARIPGPLLWHAHLAIAAARAGRGVALANSYLVRQDLENGNLVELGLPSSPRAVIGAYVFVARDDGWSRPAVAELRRYLQLRTQSLPPGAQGAPSR